jgi:hypothetical protein
MGYLYLLAPQHLPQKLAASIESIYYYILLYIAYALHDQPVAMMDTWWRCSDLRVRTNCSNDRYDGQRDGLLQSTPLATRIGGIHSSGHLVLCHTQSIPPKRAVGRRTYQHAHQGSSHLTNICEWHHLQDMAFLMSSKKTIPLKHAERTQRLWTVSKYVE